MKTKPKSRPKINEPVSTGLSRRVIHTSNGGLIINGWWVFGLGRHDDNQTDNICDCKNGVVHLCGNIV